MIRLATKDDAAAINAVYNHYVTQSAITFDIEPWSLDERLNWMGKFNSESSPYQLFVYQSEGEVVGFAYYNAFREKEAYRLSSEITLYLSPHYKGSGAGSELMNHLLKAMQKKGFKKAYSVITLPNAASVALHKKYAFNQVGKFTDVGFKFERFHSVAVYERTLRFT